MIVTVAVVFGAGILASPWLATAIPPLAFNGTTSKTTSTQIINALSREEQIVLLSLGIQGITETHERSTLFGQDVPGSGRTTFVQYGFSAKVGIDGSHVTIEETSEKSFRVHIPPFSFIGHDDETFKLVAEDNGALSWVTPEIDKVEMINSILDDAAQSQYVTDNTEILKDQAVAFYRGIIASIDPTVVVEFEFAS